MVRYTIPASILAMAVGAFGSKPGIRKSPVLTSDGEKIQEVATIDQIFGDFVRMPSLKQFPNPRGKGNGNDRGKGNGNGRGNGNGNARQDAGCDASFSAPSAGFSAVYTMTDQPDNEVLVYSRDTSTGLLTFEQAVSTGGSGGALDRFGILPLGADPLGSSDSVMVAGKCLLVCNPGSNEVTSFRIKSASNIEANDPVSTGGTWPVSIAERDGLVYVLNAGGDGSVQGFNLNPGHCGLSPVGVPVDIPQSGGPFNPDGAFPRDPPANLGAPAQIGFTPTGDVIVVDLVDGGGQNLGGPAIGTINVFHVQPDGTVLYPVVTQISRPSALPFAFVHDSQGRLLVGEAVFDPSGSGGVSVWEYGPDGSVSEIQTGISVTEPLTCWLKYNPRNGCSYTTNTNVDGSISTVLSGEDGVTLVDTRAAEVFAPIDIAISGDGNHVYTLTNQPTDPNVGGTGQPIIYVHSTSCDCSMEELQQVTDGLPSESERTAADGIFFGHQGVATYPN